MAVFKEAKEQAEQEVVVSLLTRLSEDPAVTQRSLAAEMGIALGMMSRYMQKCVQKGYVKAKEVSPRRWAYFVTPKGFAEKSRMVSGYLHRSMTFFRDTKIQLEELFADCQTRGYTNIAMIGIGDVADIAALVSKGLGINLELVSSNEDFTKFDAVLVTDIQNPQGVFDSLKLSVPEDKLLSIAVLCIARRRVIS